MEVKKYICDYNGCKKPIQGIRYVLPLIILLPEVDGIVQIQFNAGKGEARDFCSPGCMVNYFHARVNQP